MQLIRGISMLVSFIHLWPGYAGIEFAEEDKQLHAYSWPHPDDPDLPKQWAMYQLGLFQPTPGQQDSTPLRAWNRTTGSDDIIVCVIDSGVDYHHPDLQTNLWFNRDEIPDNGLDDDGNGYVDDYYGMNFLDNTGDPLDNNFHGTHLAGMIGATCNNTLGVCGMSPKVKVMGCKFLDQHGNGYTSDALRCLDYSLRMGAHVTLNSYGGLYADSTSLQSAIQLAEAAGQLFITAAGNDYGTDIDTTPTYPAAYNNCNILTVIATDKSNNLAKYSNYGAANTHIAAPGSQVLSTTPNGSYDFHDGTSQAAGYAAGAAALVLAAYQEAGYNITSFAVVVKSTLLNGASPKSNLKGKCLSGKLMLHSVWCAIICRWYCALSNIVQYWVCSLGLDNACHLYAGSSA